MANPKRTYSTVYNALKQISDEEGIDFGLGGYTEQQFKDKYFTGPGNINNLYNKLSKISDEEGVDFGLGTRDEWLGSFGYTEEDATPRQGYKPTAEDMAGFNSTIRNAGRAAGSSLGSFDNKVQNLQKRQGLNVPSRIEVGKSNNLVQGRQQLNPETGQLENTYITSSGNKYDNEALADMEQRQIDQNLRDERYKQSLPGQLDDAYAERDRLNAELAKLKGQWVDQDGRVHYGNRGNDEAAASLEAALRQNQQRITALEAERDDDGGTQFWRGFIDAAQNPSTLTFGLTDFADMIQMMRIKNKMDAAVESGQEPQLSEAEQSLLQSSYLNNYAQQQYGENRGFMYRAGGISMQALPFVAEFMATGGMGAISQKGAELGTRAAEKLALQGLSRSLVKNLGVVAGDVAAGWAMANTTGIFRTAGDVMQRNMGGVTINPEGQYDFGEYDEEGNYHRGGKSLGRSIYEAEVANTLEYYTEKLGEHLKLGKRIAGVADRLGLSKLSKAVNYLSGNKWLEHGGIQDYPSEVIEEEANLILNSALVGDNKFSDLVDGKTQMDIWGGMLFSIGLMQAPRLAYTGYSAAGYYAYKKGVDVADGNASIVFGADNWQMIKDEIDNCENDRLGELMQTVIDGDMSDVQKTATLNYAKNLVKMRGYNMGMMAGAKDEEEATSNEGMAAQAVNQSYQQGHETQEPDLMKQFNEDVLTAQQNLSQYGDEFAKEVTAMSDSPVEELNYLMSSRNYFTDEQIAAAADYYTKQARAKGMMEGALDRIDLAVENANAEVRANTHQQTGNVVIAKGNDNLDYYIVGGDIVTDPETGITSLTGTGGAVVVRDQLGNVSVKSPQDLMVYSMQPADELININETQLRQQLMQQADDDISYGSPANEVFQLEDVVTLQDSDGNTIEGEIGMMPNAQDGVYVVYTTDGKALQYTADEMNRMIVAHNGMEVQRASAVPNQGENVPIQDENVPNQDENVPNQDENVLNQPQPQPEQGGETAGGEASVESGTGANEQPASALSRIPVLQDEKGRPVMNKKGKPQYLWHKASVEDAAAALIETTGGDMLMARDTASDLVKNAQAGLEKIRKQKPKGDDPIEIAESRMEIKRQEQEQQAVIKQWQDVNQAIQKQMRDEAAARQAEIEAAKSAEQKAREAEEARQREEKQKEIDRQRIREQIEKDRERRNKEYTPLVKAREEMAGDTDALAILNDVEPRSLEEWVSSLLRPHSMLWQDASDSEIGLQSELGLKRGDMQRMISLLGTKESGAKPFGKVVLDIYEGLPEGMKNQYTDEDVRNTLLNLFNEGSSSRMMHLTEENRIEEARQTMLDNNRREAEAEMEAWAEAYHLTPEERETFEEFMSEQAQAMPNEQEFINQIIADEQQNTRGQGMDLDNTSGTAGRESEGGEEQVQGQSTTEETGTDQEEPEPESGAETDTGEPSVSHSDVSGGASVANTIQGMEDITPKMLLDGLQSDIEEILSDNGLDDVTIKGLALHGSRMRGDARDDSDLDVVMEYEGDISEDGLFNILNEAGMKINGIPIDVNPITKGKSGTLEQYMERSRKYDEEKKKIAPSEQLKPVDLRDNIKPDSAKLGESKPERWALSEKKARNGEPFYQDSNGNIDLVDIPQKIFDKINYTKAPFRLTKSMAEHVFKQHAKELHLQTVDDAIDFVVDVMTNFDHVRLGDNGSLIFSVENGRSTTGKRAITILLSSDSGDYYGIKTSGYESLSKLKKRPLLWDGSAETPSTDTATEPVTSRDAQQGGEQSGSASGQSGLSEDKDTNNSSNLQEKTEKSSKKKKNEPKRLVSDEKMEELRKKLLDKLNNLNAGIDPEMMLLGAMYAVGNIERGVTKFADYAKKMVTDLGDKIRPYLKSFYNAVRDMPEAQEYASQMDDYATVSGFDVYNFDKQQTPDTFTKAEQVVTEQRIRNKAKKIQEQQPDLFAGDLFGAQITTKPAPRTKPDTQQKKRKPQLPDFASLQTGKRFVTPEGTIEIARVDYDTLAVWDIDSDGNRIANARTRTVDTVDIADGLRNGTVTEVGSQPAIGETSTPAQIAAEEAKVDTNPSEAQKEAGNYQKGHIKIDGYDITIENPKGSIRRGTDASGKSWETKMNNTYGYIRGTEAVDGDHIDIFLSDDLTNGKVYVIDQVNPETGEFDESKVMYSFGSEKEAREAYLSNYSKGWKGLGNITEVSREDFKKWIQSSHRKTKPFAEYKSVVKSQKKKSDWWDDPNRPQSIDPKDYKTYMTPEAKEYFAQFKGGKTDFTTWAHPNLAYITAAVWDEVEIPYDELKKVPEIIEAENTIKNAESKGKLVITDDEANKLAQRLIDREQARQERKALVIIGLPAGGKSSVFANPLSKEFGARIIDSDDVKPWLDGFDGGNGAGYVQDASAEVAEKAIDIAVKNGDNIIIPRIGGKSVMDLSAALRLAGYDVQLYFNDVKGVTSIDRAASRFAQTGRYLSLDYLTKKAGVPSENFSKFAEKTIGGYLDERNQKEVQDIRRRVQGLRGELDVSGEGLREPSSTEQGGNGTIEELLQADLGGRGQQTGGNGVSILLEEPLFNYSEWKSNDVPFGQKPKEIWNSESGKPMPGKKVTTNNNNDGQGQGERAGSENQQIDEGISRRELKDSGSVVGKRLGEDLSKRGNIRQREGGISQGSPSDSGTVESTGRSSGRIQGLTENPNRNLRNNHAERGKDYAPKGVDARIEANIKAIELMQELTENGEQATPEQMAVLRQYSGWGGLGKAFDNKTATYNGKVISSYLKELLGDEAYEQANMSRNSAYFTPANVIDSMWDIARAMGFKGGNVLEGSAGIGNIIGLMPEDMSQRSNIRAVEIDSTTGNILKLLYPDAQVDIQGFEATKVPNGSVDLAITNVPFVTGLRVMDTTGDKDLSRKFHDIHDFCIAKNIRKLKEGGIGIFITSSGMLDNSKALRDWIVSDGNSDVVGAFRLNNETFGGTGATSDIIVVRKRVNGQKSPHAIDVSITSGERSAEYDTGDTKKVKGEYVPVIKKLSMDYNKYLVDHPEMMGGEMMFGFEKGDTYRPTSKALYPAEGKDQNKLLGEFTKSFADKNWQKAPSAETFTDTIYESLGSDVKEGSLLISNGRICVAQMGQAVPLNLNENKIKGHTKEECFNDYQGIKYALSDVLAYQTENEDDKGLKPLLQRLNDAYDTFINRYGHFHKNNQLAWLRNDVDYPNVFALETYKENVDPKTGKNIPVYGKAGIFSKRVVEKEKSPAPQNIKDAIIAGMYVNGRIDTQWIADKLNESGVKPPYNDKWTQDDVRKGIIVSGLGFEDPSTHEMTVAYEYLSGNVREKLQQAIDNNTDGQYDVNIKELEKKQPLEIPAHLIDFSIGSSWIDPKLYEEYVREKTDVDVTFTPAGGTWYMKTPYWVNEEKNKAMGVKSELLNKTIMGTQLIEAAMTNKTITVSETRKKWDKSTETITDKDATTACANKIDEIRQDFKDWAKAKMQADSEMAQRIEKKYNDMFNNYVPKSVPDEFVPDHFTGSSPLFTLREHQSKAAIRATTQPLLLAHEVGSGKTFTLITAAMEMRRLGTAKKPMIVVQNATLGQFVGDAKALYPNAKIIALEDKDRSAEKRKDFYARIKYNDWDLVIIPQSVFERIPDSEERQMAYIHEKIKEKMLVLEQMKEADKQGNSMIVRQAEKEIEKLEDQLADLSSAIVTKREKKDEKKKAVARQNAMVKAQEMLDRQTDDVENFDDMGIDALLIDEAHEYKHLGFATAMQRGVKGVDPSYSKKAQGVYLKTQAVLENNNGRNVVFATGTPISNTAAEVWTFMRYLMPADVMKAYDIYYFDDFVRNFGNLTQMLEFTTSGKFKENNRFAGYINLPELARIWSSVADIVTNEEIQRLREAEGKPPLIPAEEGGKDQDIYLPQTKALRSVMKYVKSELARYENMTGKQKKENSHIPLVMYGIAKAAAVDARLVVADAADEPMSKTNAAVKEILADLKATKAYKGTVAVFADNYQNKNTGFNLYEDIQKKLIAAGVPKDQVVVMKSGMSVKKKQDIFDKVNSGDVRVILGSTFTLGTGVNIQERLHLLIHIDAPNRPMDYTQRNGRILRQGNMHKEWGKTVRVVRFGVEDSLDVTAYQRLKTKGAIADSIMHSKDMILNAMENRALEEEEDVFGDTVAQLSGSEYAMLKNQAEKDVRKYEAKKKQWEADQAYVHSEIPKTRSLIRQRQDRIKELEGYLDKIDAVNKENGTDELHPLPITIDGTTYPSIEAMGDYIKEFNKKVKEAENDLRDNPDKVSHRITTKVNVGGVEFPVVTDLSVETKNSQGVLFTAIHRIMTYDCPEFGLKDETVHQSLLRNALEDITQEIMTGKDFRNRLANNVEDLERQERNLSQMEAREGKPFEFTEQLEKAHEHYDEYSELMKKEMEEKEKKYAEMDDGIESAGNVTYSGEAEDEEDEAEEENLRSSAEDYSTFDSVITDGSTVTAKGVKAVTELAGKLGLDVEILTSTKGLSGKDAKAYAFFNPRTGKISIVLPNIKSDRQLIRKLMHEGVAHFGLRKMFGEKFDNFLDSVYNNVDSDVKSRIDQTAKLNKWNKRLATEEYLASLAEDVNYDEAKRSGLWQKVKDFFMDLLDNIGVHLSRPLSDNDLRYILWRSHDRLLHPHHNIFDKAMDVQMQSRFGVNRAENLRSTDYVSDEINDIVEDAKADGTYMKAPNGQPTNLTEEQWAQVRTKAFKNWFGDWENDPENASKVVDENGEPKVMYHGTNLTKNNNGEPFWVFYPESHFGTQGQSKDILRNVNADQSTKTYEVFLNIRKPDRSQDVPKKYYGKSEHKEWWDALSDYAKKNGFDGIVYQNRWEDQEHPADSWIAFNSNQIKSATDNSGAYSPENDDIRYSTDEDVVFIPDFTDEDVAQSAYNQAMAKKSMKWKEAWQDSMTSVKAIQDAIEKETGNKATGAEDAYRFENRMHGRSKNMGEQFEWSYYKPMLEAFSRFMKKTGMDIGQAMDYMIAKHGLERNMYYAFRDAMKSKIAEEIKDEREQLEKQYAKGRMSELDYNQELARLKEKEATGVDDAISEIRDSDEYKQLLQDYENGRISYPEYIRGNEELRRNASMRKTPKKDSDGNIVSTNYYDDNTQDFSGLTGTLAKDMYDDAQKIKRAAQRTVDPDTRKKLWQTYDRQMREAYSVARGEAEKMVLDAESDRDPADKLWKAINAATKRTLQISYDSGMMDRKTYNKVRSMFDYYIPLRGWDENKASDAYTYVGKENVFSPAIKKTWGRTSQAENPLAYIGNIAISTIIAGHRNMLKQHFLNYVMNNPTSLVSISESWYENIAPEGEAPVWVLRSADTAGKSTDEIVQIVNDFNEEMQQKQAEGRAIPVTGRLRLDVNATKGQKAEHVIEVQRAGHTYQLYINGDPKAAQALNGTLPKSVSRISDTYIGRQLTKLNRNMAAFFTSKNPAFVVSNLSRDLNMAGASVRINEDSAYNARFIANVAKVLAPRMGESSGWVAARKQPTGLMPSLLRKYKKGTLDPSNETERLFKEFMEEGGETGFVNMLSIDSFKEKMQGEIARMNGSSLLGSKGAKETTLGKAFRMLGDTFEFYNRCAEDATRFIVYMTSRQTGKSLEDSIADAKDVTLNFNRKGTGDKGNAEIRDLFIFVNPAIQALSNMYRMAKGHPLKFGAVTAGFIAGGALMPFINQWLMGMFGDDDDKEAYWNLPPWVRKNNLVMWIPGTKNFLTIPLAQEFRVFYGLGEMITTSVSNHSVGNMGLELVSSVADLVPINPTGNGGNLLVDLSPTGVQPLVQIGENIDFTGKPIWRENQGNKYAPMYTKAYVSTPNWMVKLSEAVNDVTGGNEGKKGFVEDNLFWGSYLNNPAVWNHLLQGYFGGMYNTVAKGFDVITTAAGGEMPKIYQTPVINRFLNRPVERDNAGVLGEEYYSLINERDQLNYELRLWKKKAADGDAEAQKHVDEIMQSDGYQRSQVISHYEKIMKDMKAGEKAATTDIDKYLIKQGISNYRQQMSEELAAIDDGKDPLEAAMEKFSQAKTFQERNTLRMRIERLAGKTKGGRQKTSEDEVEKALAYITDEERESRDVNDKYLELATAEDILNDTRIKVAKGRIKEYTDEFRRLIESGAGERASEYRQKHLDWFKADDIISQQSRAMKNNQKLLGKGQDRNIMRNIANNRNQMLKAIEKLKIDN